MRTFHDVRNIFVAGLDAEHVCKRHVAMGDIKATEVVQCACDLACIHAHSLLGKRGSAPTVDAFADDVEQRARALLHHKHNDAALGILWAKAVRIGELQRRCFLKKKKNSKRAHKVVVKKADDVWVAELRVKSDLAVETLLGRVVRNEFFRADFDSNLHRFCRLLRLEDERIASLPKKIHAGIERKPDARHNSSRLVDVLPRHNVVPRPRRSSHLSRVAFVKKKMMTARVQGQAVFCRGTITEESFDVVLRDFSKLPAMPGSFELKTPEFSVRLFYFLFFF